jgi:hypothetical protein
VNRPDDRRPFGRGLAGALAMADGGPAAAVDRLAAALVARRDLTQALSVLERAGLVAMPLKGVLLQHTVYADPGERLLSDADLLAPPGRFTPARQALLAAGYVPMGPEGRGGVALRHPEASLEIDLHRRLFSPGLYRLPATEVFERGRLDEALFGAPVILPAPLDLYAQLVGNFAKGRHGPDDAPQVRDFAAVARHHRLTAAAVARHLDAHGLARAARYALRTAALSGDRFARRVLTHLAPDLVGDVAATVARRLTGRYGKGRGSALAPHLVNRTLREGAVSAIAHVAIGARVAVGRPRR